MRLAAAVRVVDGIHRNTSALWALALVTVAAGLADLDVLVLGVRDRSHSRAALTPDHPDLGRGQPQADHRALLRHDLDGRARGAAELAALAGDQLDVVHDGSGRDSGQRKRVARRDVGALPGDHLGADAQALRGQDVALLAVGVVEQRDARGAVGVVLDRGDAGGNPVLGALEVDLAVATLGSAAAMARGDAALGVAAAGRGLALGEALRRLRPAELLTHRVGAEAPAGAGRFCLSVCHQPSTAAPSNSSMRSPGESWTIAFFQERERPLCSPRRFGFDLTFEVRTAFT